MLTHLCLLPWFARRILECGGPLRPLLEANDELPLGGLPIAPKLSRYGDEKPYLPTLAADTSTERARLERFATDHSFPLVVKPLFGNHGRGVRRATSVDEVVAGLEIEPMIVQPYVTAPCEYGINVVRIGDRVKVYGLTEIASDGETPSETTYRDITDETTGQVRRTSQRAADQIRLNVGRFDVKARSRDALLSGEFRVLEANGSCSLDLTLYDEKHSLSVKIERLRAHWNHVLYGSGNRRSEPADTWRIVSELLQFVAFPSRFAALRGNEVDDGELAAGAQSKWRPPGG